MNSCIKADISHDELSVADFAYFATRLLAVGVDTRSWVHPLLEEALLTVALPTELTKVHLRATLKDKISAADAGASPDLLPLRAVQDKYRVHVVKLKLMISNA